MSLAAFIHTMYGIEARLSRLGGEGENHLVAAPDGARYVLKLAPPDADRAALDFEQAAVEVLHTKAPDLDLPRVVPNRDGDGVSVFEAEDGDARLARLLTFVPGTAWAEAGPAPSERLRDTGRRIAQIARALDGFDHPAARRTHRWDLAKAGALRANVTNVEDSTRRRWVEEAFLRWAALAAPALADLPHGVIHGDLNDDNLLVRGGRLAGVLDFGDALYNPLVCDPAIALTYLLLDEPDPFEAGAQIVAGYNALRPLATEELEVLFPLMCGRLAVSLVISAERRRIDPDRAAWFVSETRAWRALERYVAVDPVEAADRLSAGIGVAVFADRGLPADVLAARRAERFSGALSLTSVSSTGNCHTLCSK